MQAATSAGTARAEALGLSEAREKAGAVPAKSVRRNGINGYEDKWTFSVPSKIAADFLTYNNRQVTTGIAGR
ncbi:hypothetical protein DEX24_03260 [Kurthia sibirica]|uniref:Uncharacterized protein n=1 Tax=Kurthia sibirica TaxID=202750 RepID=A0A2U3AP89_9BACL|nr:hypothetical protein DEX24_03260 [Kurthia sibirica]